MATWAEFEAVAPEMADAGLRLIRRGGSGTGLLATVNGDEPPRINPISVDVSDGRLVAFINPSPKRQSLAIDGRYALHAHQDPAVPKEFTVRGRATLVTDPGVRAGAAQVWSFEPDETYDLFEFSIATALLGTRNDPDEWPPRYTSWSAEP